MIAQNKNNIFLDLISFISGISFSNIFPVNIYILFFGLFSFSLVYLLFNYSNKIINFFKKIIKYAKLKETHSYYSRIDSDARYKRKYYIKLVIKQIIFFFIGSILLIIQKQNYKKQVDLISNKNINIICTIINKETNNHSRIKEEITLETKKIILLSSKQKYTTKLKIKFYSYIRTKLNTGQLIIIKNIFIKNKNIKPDFKKYLIKENIIATIFGNHFDYEIIKENKNSLRTKIANLKRNIYLKLKNKIGKKSFAYFSAIFLGKKKEEISYKDKNEFNRWGISHYLARSGLHIAIFILIWQILFSFLPLNIKFKNILISLIVITYISLSWKTVSILRAFYVFIFFQISKLTDRRSNFIQILSLVCFILLVINPIQLFFLDFQLTFLLTFSLALTNNSK